MKYFVIDNKDGIFNIDSSLAKLIYKTLNTSEQNEIDLWLKNNENMKLADVIRILYGTLSQRRRMNPRLVEAVEEYNKNHKEHSLVVIKLEDNVKYIDIRFNSNGSESLLTLKDKNNEDVDDISKWECELSYTDELKNIEPEKISINEIFKQGENKMSFKKKMKKLWKQFNRWLFQTMHPNIKKMEKSRKGNKKKYYKIKGGK